MTIMIIMTGMTADRVRQEAAASAVVLQALAAAGLPAADPLAAAGLPAADPLAAADLLAGGPSAAVPQEAAALADIN